MDRCVDLGLRGGFAAHSGADGASGYFWPVLLPVRHSERRRRAFLRRLRTDDLRARSSERLFFGDKLPLYSEGFSRLQRSRHGICAGSEDI